MLTQVRVVDALKEASVYAMHGAANIVRGVFAIHPGWNLLLAVHDWKLGRLNYPKEIEEIRKLGFEPFGGRFDRNASIAELMKDAPPKLIVPRK